MKIKTVCITLILLLSFSLFSKEAVLKGKNYIVTETKDGYFNYLVLDKNSKEIPVLESGSKINSRIFIKDGESRFYLRDKSKYRYEVGLNSIKVIWETENLVITELYTFSSSIVNYNINIKNKSSRRRNIGVYLIYNTYLGEKSKNHFLIDDFYIENREKYYEFSEIPLTIKTLNSDGFGAEFRFGDDNTTRPEQIILANWDKLSKSKKWPYLPQKGGAFSYGYYSINDSGLGLVYRGKNIESGESLTNSFNISFISDKKIVLDESSTLETVEEIEDVDLPEITETIEVELPEIEIPVDKVVEELEAIDPEKEELLRMLEYIQKKKKGEDVSGYDFDENYIIEKLKDRNE